MKHQRANLNTLPPILRLSLGIHKRRVRHTARTPINLGIEAFDQCHQVRRLPIPIIPLDTRVRLHSKRFALAVRVDQLHADEVTIRHGMRIGHGQRIFEDRLDGPPDVDDLVSSFQELWGFVGEVVGNAVLRCRVGLINMDALDWTAGLGLGSLVLGCAADSMVEYEDARATSPENVSL